MRYQVFAGLLTLQLIVGCKKVTPAPVHSPARALTHPASETPPAATAVSEWTPSVKGVGYQFALKNGIFSFCDDRGSQQINLTTGSQSAGTQTCDWNNEELQDNCGEDVEIWGPSEGGDDRIMVSGEIYVLKYHVQACDQQGKLVIVAGFGAVKLINGAVNKVAIVDPAGGNRAVIGSDWIAWQSFDRTKNEISLETVAKALEHATPAE